MGTQATYSGPGDKIPLLPAWALPALNTPPQGGVTTPLASPQGGVAPPALPTQPMPSTTDGVGQIPTSTVTSSAWRRARLALGKAVGGGSSRSLRKATRRYVGARGGARRASSTATGGRRATAALGGFLSDASNRGLTAALGRIGLASTVGRDVSEVLAALVNALTPDGATKEEVAARDAVSETVEQLYEAFLRDGKDLSALEQMTREDIQAALEICVGAYIYNRWLGDLGARIEEKAITPSAAVRLERDAREFIREAIHFDLGNVDVLALDWHGQAGQQLIDTIYLDAYSLLGGER